MALIECKDCHKEFSTDAKRCPSCGAKKTVGNSWGWWIGGFIFLMFIGSFSEGNHNGPDFRIDCEVKIKNNLVSPSSADFAYYTPEQEEKLITTNSDGSVDVIGKVDAKNYFGVMLSQTYSCLFKQDQSGKWIIDKFNIL